MLGTTGNGAAGCLAAGVDAVEDVVGLAGERLIAAVELAGGRIEVAGDGGQNLSDGKRGVISDTKRRAVAAHVIGASSTGGIQAQGNGKRLDIRVFNHAAG